MGTARRVRASRGHRFPITVRPTNVDIAVASEIARDTAPAPEEVARALTWGADEKVLLVLAAAGWLASRGHGERLRRAGNHAVLVAVAAALLPHGMKRLFDQTRPDRRTNGCVLLPESAPLSNFKKAGITICQQKTAIW